ncbi:MAG: hypothetical protein AMXMBFR33_40080 [Candidatus Xenobia bacterium]
MSGKGQKSGSVKKGCLKILIFGVLGLLSLLLVTLAALLAVLNHYSRGLPDVGKLRYYEPSETTRIYAADGTLIATLFRENRTWTPLEKISPNMVKAVLAIEDRRFYDHHGVDPIGVARAAYASYKGGDKQGASTITMQLARNLFLTPKRTIDRKIKEAILAMQIEKRFTKQEILELYLNQIYFGAGAHGVQAASSTYFNKKAKDLNIVEASLLAGLPQAPTEYSPLVNKQASQERQKLVLQSMKSEGYITQAEYQAALDALPKMKIANQDRKEFQLLKYPYFTSFVIKELYRRYDEDLLYRGGLRVYTTVDLKLQKKCEELLKQRIKAEGNIFNFHQGAIVVLENGTGYIRAMVGGVGWSDKSQFNRAWQARRQPGSSFKLFVYVTALESGMTPDSVVPDSPISYNMGPGEPAYSPQNSDGRFLGAVPLKVALQHSRNVVAVRMAMIVGIDRVIDYAYRMGVREKLEPVVSLPLGACDISPLEMATAYSVVANGGIRIDPSPISVIKDSEGNIVEDNRFPHYEEVLAESTAYYMTDMLENAAKNGTGYASYIDGRRCAGKTGTTSSHRDIWFCGFTPQYTAAVWVGNDDFTQMYGVFGGDVCAPLWKQVMMAALEGKPNLRWKVRKGPTLPCLMCTTSHKRAGPNCPKVYREYYKPGQLPGTYCDSHGARPLPSTGIARPAPTGPARPTGPASPTAPVEEGPGEIPTPVEVPLGEGPLPLPEPVADPGVPGGEAIPAPEPIPIEIPMEAPPEPAPVPIEAPPPEPGPAGPEM